MAFASVETAGRVITIDRRGCERLDPTVWTSLADLELSDHVTTIVAERSLTWELGKMQRDEPAPRFDFCFFDAGHTWGVTGFAFLLVDRLIEPGGWVLLDYLTWTQAGSPSVDASGIPEEEAHTAQACLAFDILVARQYEQPSRTHNGKWGWARNPDH